MIASKQGNSPRWTGSGFEIWFFVVLVPGSDRALWVRLTRFADSAQSNSRVWAVVSDRGEVTATRETFALDALTTNISDPDLHVRVGEAELGHGFARGRCGSIAWEFEFDATDALVERLPHLPHILPVGTHSTHPHAEAKVRGWVELDGARLDLDGGMFTQMHLWGSQRVDWLRWVWAPRFEGHGEDTELELTAVAPRAGGPNLCAVWARTPTLLFDQSGLSPSLRASVESPRPGVLHHVTTTATRRLVVRAWAPAETFAGWEYRRVGGGTLRVAQSNLGHVELEIYRRVGLGWRPEQRLRSTCAAIEVHGLEDHPDFDYVPWDAPGVEAREGPHGRPARPSRHGRTAPTSADGPGEWIDTVAPPRIVALGLTYRAHARETSSTPDAVVFEKDPQAWTAGGGVIVRPDSKQLVRALAALDPELPAQLAGFGWIPAMLDYEVELGLVLLDGLDDPASPGRVGLVVANDVSARLFQILGEGQADRLDYWRVAKSFPGFAPTSPQTWVPDRFDLDRWPALTLETRVNGAVRQQARVDLLIETPREMLARVRAHTGALEPGTLVLTGTPAGVALSVPRWKRVLGELLLDRVGRVRAALAGYSSTMDFLRPGDVVEVSAGFLGGIEHLVQPDESERR